MNMTQLNQLAAVDGWVNFEDFTIKEIKEQKTRTQANRLMVKVKASDGSNAMGMWLYADKRFAPGQQIKGRGMLREYQGVRYVDYAKAEIIGQANIPFQRENQTNNGEREMRIVRGNALNAAMSAAEIPLDMVKDYLLAGVEFILTGKWKLLPQYSAE